MARYHCRVYDPYDIAKYAPKTIRQKNIKLSLHAKFKKKARNIQLTFPICHCYPVEYETNKVGQVTKVLMRAPYTDERDLCISLSYDGCILTVWTIAKDDQHDKLNTSNYVQNPYAKYRKEITDGSE